VAIVALHVGEHASGIRRAALRSVAAKALAAAGCATLLLAGTALQGFGEHGAGGPSVARAATPYGGASPAPDARQLGVTTASFAENETTAWQPSDLGEVNAFEHVAQAHVGIVQWFADWGHDSVDVEQLRAVAARGSTPQITWEPWDRTHDLRKQPDYTLASIIRGRHDAYIRSWARDLDRYGRPVLIRFAQEMNGIIYPWAEAMNGNRPGEYARAWRHIHDIFTAEGATNVRWVWCPKTGRIPAGQYPGDRYVDVVSLSGFNGGSALPWGGWRTFADAFDAPLQSLRRIAPDKPVQISEVGTVEAGGSKPQWIKQMFDYLDAHTWIRSVIWFDLDKQADWRVATSPAAQRAFVDGVAGTRSSTTGSASSMAPPPSRRATSVPSSYQRSDTAWPQSERRRGSEALQRIGSWSGSPV
jgi:beta-mannanase